MNSVQEQKVCIYRYEKTKHQTLGILSIHSDKHYWSCHTIELPWRENKPNISCIPTGIYQVVKRVSDRFNEHFHILDVPGRNYILIHPGNFHSQTKGCVLVGSELHDINGDGEVDVVNSKVTMKKLLEMLPEKFHIKIENKNEPT